MRSYDKKEPILGHCCVLKSVIKQIFNLFSAKANLNHMNSFSVKNWVAPCETKCQKGFGLCLKIIICPSSLDFLVADATHCCI